MSSGFSHTRPVALRRRGRFSLLQRVYVLVGALLVVSVVITGVTFALRQRVEASTDNLISRIVPAQTETAQLITAYSDQENRVRAFLLTDDASFLTDYTLGQANAAHLQESLGEHLAGDPVVHKLVGEVASAARRWHEQSVEPLISRNRGTGP